MKKIILVDFDDTLVTRAGDDIVYNDELIEALIQAKQAGSLIIGFTNWYSKNYQLGSLGRLAITQDLEKKGLVFDAINTTWSASHVAKLIVERKEGSQSSFDYVQSLSEVERLALLDHYYQTSIKAIEEKHKYVQGNNKKIFKTVSDSEAGLALNNATLSVGTARNQLKLIPTLNNFNDAKAEKEEMFRVLFALLGTDNEYIVFDDKNEVTSTAHALADDMKIALYPITVRRMKALKRGVHIEGENGVGYNHILNFPEAMSNKFYLEKQFDTLQSKLIVAMEELDKYMLLVKQSTKKMFSNNKTSKLCYAKLTDLQYRLISLLKNPNSQCVGSFILHMGVLKQFMDDIVKILQQSKQGKEQGRGEQFPRFIKMLGTNIAVLEKCFEDPHFEFQENLKRDPFTLKSCVGAAARMYRYHNPSEIGKVAELQHKWLNVDEGDLVEQLCDFLQQKEGGYGEFSLKGLVTWYIYNRYDLKSQQPDIFENLPVKDKGIRHNCNHPLHGKKAIQLVCDALKKTQEGKQLLQEEPGQVPEALRPR